MPYLADVARLEYARVVSYHAADADALSNDETMRVLGSGDPADAFILGCHPSLIAFTSSRAAVSIWAAHQGGDENLEGIDLKKSESCWVIRDALDVLAAPVPAGATTFVRSIQCGAPLGQAASDGHQADVRFDVAATLSLLVYHGALISMRRPEGKPS